MCSATESEKTSLESRARRRKRDKDGSYQILEKSKPLSPRVVTTKRPVKKSKALQKHGEDGRSGGMEALIPSFIGLCILVGAVMARMGFRGRASVAGIDLGTTNSVICVQAPSKGVGTIDCIPDPMTNSSIIPSAVSFLEASERVGIKKVESKLVPNPSHVVVGQAAKRRIDSHPHQTLYNAKRLLGRPFGETAEIQKEVEFRIAENENDQVVFQVPHDRGNVAISPRQVGSYVVQYLMSITEQFLGHDNVKSAVICVPAKFNTHQRQVTVDAFQDAGVKVTRIVEEPTAAALAYGLHKKENVHYILVYDFGGGTLDISVLHVSDGYVGVMGSDGDDFLGGADFDAAVAHHLTERHGDAVKRVHKVLDELDLTEDGLSCPTLELTPLCTMSSFHTIGERLKIGLSSYPNGGGKVVAACLTLPKSTGKLRTLEDFCAALQPEELLLTSKDYDKAVMPLYDRSVLPIRRVLEELSLEKDEIDEVVMVGGTTRMPQIRRLVQKEMKVERLNTHIDPDITVAYGAASVID